MEELQAAAELIKKDLEGHLAGKYKDLNLNTSKLISKAIKINQDQV